jgi:hypothetical protein
MSVPVWADVDSSTPGEDRRLNVRFYMGTLPDPAATASSGVPKFKDVPHIRIVTPGDARNIIERPAWDDEDNKNSDSQRFPRQWAAFKAGESKDVDVGTPLAEWPGISRSRVEELAMQKIRTVEQLAGLTDNICDRIMGSVALRQSARDFLKYQREQAPLAELRAKDAAQAAELTDLKDRMRSSEEASATENARLRQELEALSRVINRRPDEDADAPPVKRGPGRPPKTQPASAG